MQQFPCPFCGLREEREFWFAGEAGKTRPNTTTRVSDEDWARYLFAQRNAKGAVEEAWTHLTCRELSIMQRDSVSMEVLGVRSLREPEK